MALSRATYRLQFNRDFTFRDAVALLPYLASLGVSHVYASPLTEAHPGSAHGYDIVDHNRLNPEIGGEADFSALVAALHERGMGLILDIVPNHMGIGADNAWWVDVLEWGEVSPYARYFDINWDAARSDLKGRVLLPVLGDHYGAALTNGEIELRFDRNRGSFCFTYYEHRFPVSPLLYGRILAAGGQLLFDLSSKFTALRAARHDARMRAEILRRQLADAAQYPEICAAVETAVKSWAGTPGRPGSFRPIHRLLENQAYRLAYWRVAADEINYRRFFNINDLAGLRIELPELFEKTHQLVFELAERGDIDGVRVDHIDGLFDPDAYVTALRQRCPTPFYLVVEKIVAPYEKLPEWPIDGSTGYDFANQVLRLFVDPRAERTMTRLYRRLARQHLDFDAVLTASKQRIMRVNLASEMNVLAQRFHRLSLSDWSTRDFTFNAMLAALERVIAAFPVYRTYVSERGATPEDRRYVDWAIGQVKKQARTADTGIFDFLHDVLLGSLRASQRSADVLRTAMQFQQVTGPVMAKAAEDTAFYRYFRLIALNDVGGDPRRFSLSPGGFHHLMHERARDWPRAMSATATHDSKRGEDGRIRIAMLSELPEEWGRRVSRWLRINRSRRGDVDGDTVPDRNTEYLFYQTLVGAWPPDLEPADAGVKALAERMAAYMVKAVREGKEVSSWSNPNQVYENALGRFVEAVLDNARPNAFLADFHGFIEKLSRPSAVSSLAQLTIKLTAPGLPDIYRGCELWDFNLVDPDNRRPVDWSWRGELLDAVATANPGEVSAQWRDGREKLFVTHRLLRLRQQYPALFSEGEYVAVCGEDEGRAAHLLAFARRYDRMELLIAVPRLIYRLFRGGDAPDWADMSLPLPHGGPWRDAFTRRRYEGAEIPAATLFAGFPVSALLVEAA
jgi:(1->4)-alpha-D-glucan 1-alpha-D-glucosylmutase